MPSATPINLKLEAWLLQSLSWGWREGGTGSLTGRLRYGEPVPRLAALWGEEKVFPHSSITLRIRLSRVELRERAEPGTEEGSEGLRDSQGQETELLKFQDLVVGWEDGRGQRRREVGRRESSL